jgi:hypothetical protein
MTKILLGADPELFMRDPKTGAFVSAHGMVPGTKHEPFKVPFGAVQIDGTALEFNIDPASTVEQFIHNIQEVKATISSYVPGYNVVAEPVALYNKEYFDWDIPGEAKELGCTPDYNGWTTEINPRPDPQGEPLRTAAGHVHIGWTEDQDVYDSDHFLLCCSMARQLDYYLGVYSLLWDGDATRRQLYGRAGAFRPKSYGLEYRVLSNRWLSSDDLISFVYKQSIRGVQDGLDGKWAVDTWADTAANIINNNLTDWPEHFGLSYAEEIPKAA